MNIQDFEKKLQELDPDITIRTNPNHQDIAGVYWGELYLGVSVPPVEIKDKHDASYVDGIGYPYKYQKLAYDLVVGKLKKFKQEMADDPSLFVDEPNKE